LQIFKYRKGPTIGNGKWSLLALVHLCLIIFVYELNAMLNYEDIFEGLVTPRINEICSQIERLLTYSHR
jgi:hypothetical protein